MLYFYALLLNIEKSKEKLVYLIVNKKFKKVPILIQICILSGIITLGSTLLNADIIQGLVSGQNSIFLHIVSFSLGFFAPLGIIFSYFIFMYVASLIQVLEDDSIKGKLFSISIIAYLPVFIGSVINILLNISFGVSEFGYTTAYGIYRPENQTLIALTQEIDPFKFLGILTGALLYSYTFKKKWSTIFLMVVSWYVINFVFIFFSR